MTTSKYQNYLLDLGTIVDEYARESILEYNKSKGTEEEQFKSGYAMGFLRFVTLMQEHAEAFEIPVHEIGLDKITEDDFFK